MDYPVNIVLKKLNTLEDAEYPQKEKYPDGYEKLGLMWEHNKPKVGEPFLVLTAKTCPTFHTSTVIEILEEKDNSIIFKTLNSMYQLTYY